MQLNAGKKIAFLYFQYDGRSRQQLRNDGKEYVCSPWMLVWNGDYYFVLAHADEHGVTPFRVDRIAATPRILDENAVPQPEDYDLTRHLNTSFGMFIRAPQRMELICDNCVMDHIVDRFGDEVETAPLDENTFRRGCRGQQTFLRLGLRLRWLKQNRRSGGCEDGV